MREEDSVNINFSHANSVCVANIVPVQDAKASEGLQVLERYGY